MMKPNEKSVTENPVSDVVVIGAGGGGLPAAVAAAELGAKVIVLEKRHVAGGNAAIAGGILAVDSRLQRLNKVEASVDEIFKRAMAYAHWKIDPSIMRAFLDRYDMVPDSLGPFQEEIPSEREHFFWMLTLENGIYNMRANLEWAESVIERIKNGQVPAK